MKKARILFCVAFVAVPTLFFFDQYLAPLFFSARLERLFERNLPRAEIENGCVYCRMKADDFWPSIASDSGQHLGYNGGGCFTFR